MEVQDTIYNLDVEQYHNAEPYSEYLSSTQIKHYMVSPKYAKYAFEHPEEFAINPDSAAKGSLFHHAMEHFCKTGETSGWKDGIIVFNPPINPKTEQPYGVTSQKYKDALSELQEKNKGAYIYSQEDIDLVNTMTTELLENCGDTSTQIAKILSWGKPEVSHFVEYNGCKFKYRPDLETEKKIVDWKTVSADDLHEDTIAKTICKFGYDISAAFYQFFEHERTGVWKDFYWIMQQKNPPYDAVLVSAENFAYKVEDGMVKMGIGALKLQKLLDMHISCKKSGVYEGAQSFIMPGVRGRRIMKPESPAYENYKTIEFFQ